MKLKPIDISIKMEPIDKDGKPIDLNLDDAKQYAFSISVIPYATEK